MQQNNEKNYNGTDNTSIPMNNPSCFVLSFFSLDNLFEKSLKLPRSRKLDKLLRN